MKTYSAKPADIKRQWWLIDATDLIVGRVAGVAVNLLKGKNKTYYSPNLDCGDHIVVINAEKLHLTGKKMEQRQFFWHTGHPGGIKDINPAKTLSSKHPERMLHRAVERMLPRTPFGSSQLSKLHIYAGSEHPHAAQQPKTLDVAALNPKNKKRV